MTDNPKKFIKAVAEKFNVELIYTDRFVFPAGIDSLVVIAIFNFYREFYT